MLSTLKANVSTKSKVALAVGIIIILLLIAILVIVAVSYSRPPKVKCLYEVIPHKPITLGQVKAQSTMLAQTDASSVLNPKGVPFPNPSNLPSQFVDGEPVCEQVENPPAYDCTLTWYGVQTDGPNTAGVVDINMYLKNAKQILAYMYQSPIKYTGILLHLDPPTPANIKQGKPENFSAHIDDLVTLIDSIPTQYRVGFHASVESDAVWQISYGTLPTYQKTKCALAGTCTQPNACTNSTITPGVNACPYGATNCGADGKQLCTKSTCDKCWVGSWVNPDGSTHWNATDCASYGCLPGTTSLAQVQTCGTQTLSNTTPDVNPATNTNTKYCWYPQYVQYNDAGKCSWHMAQSPCAISGTCDAAPNTTPIPSCGPAPPKPGPTKTCGPQTLANTNPDVNPATNSNSNYCYYAQYKQTNDAGQCSWHLVPSPCAASGTCTAPPNTTPLPSCGGSAPAPAPSPSPPHPHPQPPRIKCTSTPEPPYGTTASDNNCWYISNPGAPGTILLDPAFGPAPSGFSAADVSAIQWGGGPLPCDKPTPDTCASVTTGAITNPSGAPYQTFGAQYNGVNACPYKVAQPPKPAPALPFPAGCPGNMSRLAWYICLINARLRQRGSKQTISMMNWDAEGNGPTGLQCATFQFVYGIRAFGSTEDVLPRGRKWTLFQNGTSGLSSDAATPASDVARQKTQCGYWDKTPINLGAKASVSGLSTYGDMAEFQAAPEYYWFDGQDMGGAAASPNNGFLPSLAAAGYLGCPQSAPGKPGVDKDCGCRRTVYETYGHVNDGGKGLVDALSPIYGLYTSQIPNSTPTFSIEHTGNMNNASDFGQCVNAQNFCSDMTPNGCRVNSKCPVRCGVANFFGNWSELCFKQFLDQFAAKYGAKSLMVYDAGFIPASWLKNVNGAITSPSITCTTPTNNPTTCVSNDTTVCSCP